MAAMSSCAFGVNLIRFFIITPNPGFKIIKESILLPFLWFAAVYAFSKLLAKLSKTRTSLLFTQ